MGPITVSEPLTMGGFCGSLVGQSNPDPGTLLVTQLTVKTCNKCNIPSNQWSAKSITYWSYIYTPTIAIYWDTILHSNIPYTNKVLPPTTSAMQCVNVVEGPVAALRPLVGLPVPAIWKVSVVLFTMKGEVCWNKVVLSFMPQINFPFPHLYLIIFSNYPLPNTR